MLRLMRQAASGRYQPQGDLADADCVLGQAFGFRDLKLLSPTPGPSNLDMAYEIFIRAPRSIELYLQAELVGSVLDLGFPTDLVHQFGSIGDRITTHEILRQELQAVVEDGHQRAALWATAHHIPRCQAIAERLIKDCNYNLELIVPPGLPAGFDRWSAQWWTRGRCRWALKEVGLVIPHHLAKGLM